MSKPGASLTDVPLFASAEPEHLRRLAGRAQFASYDPGELILDFEDDSDDVFCIVSGRVRVVIRTTGGREVILGDLGAGQVFGDMAAIDGSPRSASITALNRSSLWRMGGKAFLEGVTESPIVARRMMQFLSERVRTGNARLVEHAALTIRFRLYAELLREARPRGPGSPERIISPPPVQQVLAGRIGARREAVSREIAELIRRGIVSRNRAGLILHRPEDLEAAVASELQE
jgi:CRP/FNR family transcriptional regulator, cyclic AMP receptor protein